MNGQVRSVIGIDIGNSGLRFAKLSLQPLTELSRPDCIECIARIDWKLSHVQTKICQGESTTVPSFYPDDPQWLSELARLANSPRGRSESKPASDLECPQNMQVDSGVGHWFISSVRRDALALLLNFLTAQSTISAHTITFQDVGLHVAVQFPERVGIDRLLAARAAMDYVADRPLIVVQAGSAITVDWVTAENAFAGGAIVPGMPMMLRLLGQAADMLPEVEASELIDLPPLPGKDSEQAMRCGVSSAVVGGTEHLIRRYRSQSSPAVPVILSGGDGPRLAKHLTPPIRVIDHLVLLGIARVAAQQLGNPSKTGHVDGRI